MVHSSAESDARTRGVSYFGEPCLNLDTHLRARAQDDPLLLGRLVLALETLPALNRMQPQSRGGACIGIFSFQLMGPSWLSLE